MTIGFWGYPNPKIVEKTKKEYPNAEWIDLDIDFGYQDKNILPDSYCKIVKNIINNTVKLNPEKIIAPIGKDKCDSGWFAAKLLKDLGYNVEESIYESLENPYPIEICTSNMPLYDKFVTITDNIIQRKKIITTQCQPKFGFWGVPPND